MARASTPTLLPLDRYFEILGVDPLHANQIVSTLRPAGNACADVWVQYDWQDVGKISRETIAIAINQAENKIANYLGYWPAPRWSLDEYQNTTRPLRPELFNISGKNLRGMRKSVELDWKYVIAGGVEAKDLIEAGAVIVYTDEDGDSYKETATITVTVASGRDACEVAAYHPGHSGEDGWEIRPIDVTVVGTTATIVARRDQLVLENLWEALDPSTVDGDEDANFLTTVDVYRHYNDPSDQALFIWEEPDLATVASQTGFLGLRDRRNGIVSYTPGVWDADNDTFTIQEFSKCRDPERMELSYYSGWRDRKLSCSNNQMDRVFEFLIARLATSLLDGELCGCENFRKMVDYWRDDTAINLRERTYSTTQRLLENPFGTTRAGIYVWETLSEGIYLIGQGAKYR